MKEIESDKEYANKKKMSLSPNISNHVYEHTF